MDDERDLLVEQVAAAWRPSDVDGAPRSHPAWHDLDASGRREAFEVTVRLRQLEAALDPQGLSSTAKEVLRRLQASS